MMPTCYKALETKFYAPYRENRESRIEILKNTPTAFYLMLKFEDFLDDKNFNDETNVGGLEMVDFLLLMSLFNDINYYKDQIDLENIKKSIGHLIKDEDTILELLQKYKSAGKINKTDEIEEIRPISLLFEMDPYDNSRTLETELDLVDFRKIMSKRVIKFNLELNEAFEQFSQLTNPLPQIEQFNLKIGDKYNDTLEFLKNKISTKQILFINYTNSPDILLKVKITLRENEKTKISVEICPKSEKIKDILKWLEFLSKHSEKSFELNYKNEQIGFEKIPKITLDEKLLKIYEDIDKFNDKYNLEMTHEYDYEFQGEDFGLVKSINSMEETHVIKRKNINVTLKMKISDLDNLLNNETFNLNLTYNQAPIKLLNNNIDLGEHTVSIEKAEIRNKKELKEVVETHDSDDTVSVLLYIKEHDNKDITLDFSSNYDED